MSVTKAICIAAASASKVSTFCSSTAMRCSSLASILSAPFGDGCCEKPIVNRKRAGTRFVRVFAKVAKAQQLTRMHLASAECLVDRVANSLQCRVATTAFAQPQRAGRFSSWDLFAVHGTKSPFFPFF